jgi:predicted peptidase
MSTRRDALRLIGSASFGRWLIGAPAKNERMPALAPGAPVSRERTALIESFQKQSEGLQEQFEARVHKKGWVMPYRLFRPQGTGKLPLVVYLHGSGGQGDDNEKQLKLGNIFGTRLWLVPGNQKRFPCYVLAPQTDRGWIHYDFSEDRAKITPGLGEGPRATLEVIDELRREFPIDDKRIYVTGQSMGGAGAWHIIAHRPRFFAAAAICCGSASSEDGTGSITTPVWNFHGDADATVPVSLSRERIAARRKAGGHPLSTEYAGVDHNSWEWAYTEPELVKWMFSQRRA